jgi:hypothetical protein
MNRQPHPTDCSILDEINRGLIGDLLSGYLNSSAKIVFKPFGTPPEGGKSVT